MTVVQVQHTQYTCDGCGLMVDNGTLVARPAGWVEAWEGQQRVRQYHDVACWWKANLVRHISIEGRGYMLVGDVIEEFLK